MMVGIVEVSPRDGLQNENTALSTAAKVDLIGRISPSGVTRIEAVSFAHPTLVPAMADAEAVLERVDRSPGVSYIGLVLNHRGFDRAIEAGVDEVNIVVPASDGFAQANQNATTESLTQFAEQVVADAASHGLFPSVTVATAFGCPFDGVVGVDRVAEISRRAATTGAKEIAIADTIGVGVPTQVWTLLDRVHTVAPDAMLRAHFHNTRNTGYANAVAVCEWGVDWLDSANGGIGGCPFAPAATGNTATEDLVYLLEHMGIRTGLSLTSLVPTAEFLSEALGYDVPALLPRAGDFSNESVR